MAVQIFLDPADQFFMAVGSAVDTRPDQVAQQIRNRCRLFSIKHLFIAPCKDLDLWLGMLASIKSYLKPTCELIGVPQAGAILTNNLLNDLNDPARAAKFQKQMNDHSSRMQLMSTVLKMLEDTSKAIIGNIR
jgi:Type III secretion needle MxiH, YscF, SsaG, EprI, PscF, EscF